MRKSRKSLIVFLTFVFVFQFSFINTYNVSSSTITSNILDEIKILEIQPGDRFDLPENYADNNIKATITQMPMSQFIGNIDQINGKYDIVYVGNNTQGDNYSARTKIINQGLFIERVDAQKYANENDITNKRAGNPYEEQQTSKDSGLRAFVESGQLTVFDKSIFNYSLKDTKLYKNFEEYRNRNNFIELSASSDKTKNIQNIISDYKENKSKKRAKLNISQKPLSYTDDQGKEQFNTDRNMLFEFSVDNPSKSMKADLYLDMNGDGLFKNNENKKGININNGTEYLISYVIPEGFCGIMPWKLEFVDTTTNIKSYEVGYTVFKGNPVTMRVLQLVPQGNTFSLKDKIDKLQADGLYKISVTEMNIDNFNKYYPNNAPTTTVGNNAPTKLNGNYDMIIFGFADCYGYNVIAQKDEVKKEIKEFIKTGQSVMFTHDTVWDLKFDGNPANLWLRDIVGQSWFKDEDYYKFDQKLIFDTLLHKGYNPTGTNPDGTKIPHDTTPDLRLFEETFFDYSNHTKCVTGGFNVLSTVFGEIFDSMNKKTDTDRAYRINQGSITMFPNQLKENITIGDSNKNYTHGQYYQLNLEDENVIPWYTLSKPSKTVGASNQNSSINNERDPRNFYYTYSKGNITYSGTGHNKPNDGDELDLLINTIIKASRTANHAPTLQVKNLTNGQQVPRSQEKLEFSFIPNDIDGDKLIGNVSVYTDTGNIINIDYNKTELPLGKEKEVTLDLTKVPKDVYSFKIKVQVQDWKGAKAEEIITIYIKPINPEIKRVITNDGVKVKVDIEESEVSKEIFYNGEWQDYTGPVPISEGQKVRAKQVKQIDENDIESDEITRYISVRELH